MRRIVLYGIIVFQLILIGSLVKGIQLSLSSRERIDKLEEKRRAEQARAEELAKQEEYVQSEYYLEKVAREELHLAKPGEKVVIVPELSGSSGETKRVEVSQEKPNYLKWWEVVIGSGK